VFFSFFLCFLVFFCAIWFFFVFFRYFFLFIINNFQNNKQVKTSKNIPSIFRQPENNLSIVIDAPEKIA